MKLLALAFTLLSGAAALAAEHRPPNIVVILVDDMGFSDLSCYGSEIPTPNLDALAAGGLKCTQVYNTGRCCPTRACVLAGLYPPRAGVGVQLAGARRGPAPGSGRRRGWGEPPDTKPISFTDSDNLS